MNEKEYDVIVIGAGPGGYVCAIRTAQLGLKTAIVDKQWMGGICLNVGCIPSKSLLRNAELAYTLRKRPEEFGISFSDLHLDFGAAVRRSRKVADRLRRGVETLMKKNDIDVHMGTAELAARDLVQITDDEGKEVQIKAKNIVLATGTHAMYFPGWEVDGKTVFTYREAILQEHLPESVVIVGGGAIGMEFATLWHSYGTEVTVVEMLPHLLPLEDADIGAEMTKCFRRYGVKVLTGHRVQSVKKTEHGARVTVLKDDVEKTLDAEQVLIASGFRPNTSGLGLEKVGVALNERGYIEIDSHMETNIPGVWAIGDVTGKLLLAHVASAQGVVCAESIAGVETETLNYQMMPKATYSHPEVASFGYTEVQAQELGCEVKVGRFPFLANGKALGLGESNGFAKIVSNAKTGEILGAHLIGPSVSELLPELTLAWKMGATAEEISRNVHAHPTLGEVIMEATQIYAME